jgi:RHS repeat-associated protein
VKIGDRAAGEPRLHVAAVGYDLCSVDPRQTRTVTTCLDALGRISWVSGVKSMTDCASGNGPSSPGQAYALETGYEAHGGMNKLRYGNALYESTSYNNRLQPLQIGLGLAVNGTEVWRHTLEYASGAANNGNIQAITLGLGTPSVRTAFRYDKLNRLTGVAENPSNEAAFRSGGCGGTTSSWCDPYVFDERGNRAAPNDTTAVAGLAALADFGTDNRIVKAGWSQDARGNIDKLPGVDGTFDRIAYDAENHMRAYCSGTAPSATTCAVTPAANVDVLTYDAVGRRVTKQWATGSITTFVYDASGQMTVEVGTGPAIAGTVYVTADHLGSTRVITDGTRAVKERRDYKPFGQEIAVSSSDVRFGVIGYGANGTTRVKFTGKERDAETGLDYFGARFMSAAQGRFTSPDLPLVDQHPSDPQSWNLYVYVRNNPLRNIDPSGRDCIGAAAGMQSGASCKDQLIGGVLGIADLVPATLNLPTTAANLIVAPFTDFRFPELFEHPKPANEDQRRGMESAQVSIATVTLLSGGASALSKGGSVAVAEAPPSGGRLGSTSTRAQNSAIADSLESRGFTITGGGGRLPEEYLPGSGPGTKGGTFVDTTAVRDGRTVRVQTIDTRADGITPTGREAAAAARIRAQQRPRDHTVLIPKK